jgi:hypothetical protein
MTLPANQFLTNTTLLQSKVDDLERRLALLEQYIQVSTNGGLSIKATSGGIAINAINGNVSIYGSTGATISGAVNVWIQTYGQIFMNKAPTIQP